MKTMICFFARLSVGRCHNGHFFVENHDVVFSRLSWADVSGNCFFMKNQDARDVDFWRVMLGVILIVLHLL